MIDTRYNQCSILLFMNEIFLIKADQWRMLLFPIEQNSFSIKILLLTIIQYYFHIKHYRFDHTFVFSFEYVFSLIVL
jgi:hypothetical protein